MQAADDEGELRMRGFEFVEAIAKGAGDLVGLLAALAAARAVAISSGGVGQLLAGLVVERIDLAQLRFQLVERGAEFFQAIGHGRTCRERPLWRSENSRSITIAIVSMTRHHGTPRRACPTEELPFRRLRGGGFSAGFSAAGVEVSWVSSSLSTDSRTMAAGRA